MTNEEQEAILSTHAFALIFHLARVKENRPVGMIAVVSSGVQVVDSAKHRGQDVVVSYVFCVADILSIDRSRCENAKVARVLELINAYDLEFSRQIADGKAEIDRLLGEQRESDPNVH